MRLGLFSPSPEVPRDWWLTFGGGCWERVEIEIGPGNCGYLKAAAAAVPSTLHVGIEILPGSLARAGAALPRNLHLLVGDGGWMVEHLFQPGSIDAFHVYFPDPWWKKRHHKRRLFQPAFCAAAREALRPGGAVHVVTDVVPLFAEIRERMLEARFAEEAWQRTTSDLACSAYERKYRQQGRRFEQAIFRKP